MEESHPSSSSNQQKPWEPIVKLYRPEALMSENELYDNPKFGAWLRIQIIQRPIPLDHRIARSH